MKWIKTSEQHPIEDKTVLVWCDADSDNIGLMCCVKGLWWSADTCTAVNCNYDAQEAPLYWAYIELPESVENKQY